MKINISTDQGIQELQKELDRVQHRSRARNITPDDIVKAAQAISDHLQISKKALTGCKFDVDIHAKNMMSYLSSIPESTIFTLEFRNNHWLVTDVRRDRIFREGSNVKATYTDAAKEALAKRFYHFKIQINNTLEELL